MKNIKIFISLLIACIFFIGCNEKNEDELKIGFLAGLSGKYSALGIDIRDGFLLAFDEIDYTINEKKIRIIQKDDKQDKKEAQKVIEYFIKNDIKIIVGNATSSMTKISFDEVNKQKEMLLFSATASSNEFSSKDDNFLRTQVESSAKRYKTLLNYVDSKGYEKIFVIYDSKNLSYANGYLQVFQEMLVQSGGNKFVEAMDLNNNYETIIDALKTTKNDLILIVGNSIDSANIIQYIRHSKITTDILGSGWAKTTDFITNGGKSVEGVVFSTGYDDNSKDKNFLEFVNKFEKKYKVKPSVFAAQGYELGKILIENLLISTETKTLKSRILQTSKYSGLQGDIIFDKYGDVDRDYFMMEVKNQSFEKINVQN